MICPSYADPQFFIFSSQVPPLLYYSSLPAVFISLLVGFFVFFKSSRSLLSKILLVITLIFSAWVLCNLVLWTNNNSDVLTFFWMFFGILGAMIVLLAFYFVYVFINKIDVGYKIKILWIILIAPLILFNQQNAKGFDLIICAGIENVNSIYNYYYYGFIFLLPLWILIYSIFQYRKAEKEFKSQIVLMTIGIELFLFSFFTASFLASYLVDKGIIHDFGLENYGLFGMTFFIGMIAYLIVKYKVFNIKLLGVQALVVGLVALIAAEFFFFGIGNTGGTILIAATVLAATVMGIFLVNSVKNEVKRKEELQYLSDRLASANDQLQKLDNAKSDFISIASHQLRTPLTAIKGFVSLLLEGSYGKIASVQQEDALNKVFISNDRLILLVEDLLNISRIESGRMEFKFEKTKVEDLCQEVIENFILKAKDKKLTLEYKKPEKVLPEITVDPGKVHEVISNMVDNAIKYTPKGGVVLKLEQAGENIRVTVSDTGIGIPKDELPYLFSKFSRGKDVNRLTVTGTGLGLYVGKSLVEANGGKIWAESDGASKGSRFIIELPIVQSKEILDKQA